MAALSQAAQNYIDDLANQPGARQPATLREIWDAEWKRGGLDTITGVGRPLYDARGDLASAIEAAAGKPLADYAAEKRVLLGSGVTIDQDVAILNSLADTLPREQQEKLQHLRDVRRRAVETAQATEREAAEVSASTYGLSGTATAWMAAIARQSIDPVNLSLMVATSPIGGTLAGGAARFIARQAAAGAVAQAAVEPYIEPARAEMGLEAGFGRAVGNVLEAGIGGAAIGGAGVALHHVFSAAARSFRTAREQPTQAAPADAVPPSPEASPAAEPVVPEGSVHPNLVPEDFEAVALLAERDAVVAPPSGLDPVVHAQGIRNAETAIETGRPVPLPERQRELVPDIGDTNTAQALTSASKPIEAPAQTPDLPTARAAADGTIGDPTLARDVESRLARMPESDFQVHVEQPDGTVASGPASRFLREIQDDAKAVHELLDCIGASS